MGRRVCGVGARRRTPRRDLRRTGQRPFYRGTGKYFNRSPTRHPPSRLMTGRKLIIRARSAGHGNRHEPMNVVPGPLHWRLRRGVQSRGGCVARSRGGGAQERRGRGAASRLLVAPRAPCPLSLLLTLLPKTRDVEQRLGAWDLGLAAARLNSRFVI